MLARKKFHKYQVKVVSSVVLANLIEARRDVVEPSGQLLHHEEDVTVWAAAGAGGRRVVPANNLAFTYSVNDKIVFLCLVLFSRYSLLDPEGRWMQCIYSSILGLFYKLTSTKQNKTLKPQNWTI